MDWIHLKQKRQRGGCCEFTPNATVNEGHTSPYECSVRAVRKKNSDGGDYGNKKCRRGDDGAYGVFWRGQRLAGVWSQAVAIELMRLAKI